MLLFFPLVIRPLLSVVFFFGCCSAAAAALGRVPFWCFSHLPHRCRRVSPAMGGARITATLRVLACDASVALQMHCTNHTKIAQTSLTMEPPSSCRSVPLLHFEIGEAAQECHTHWWATNPVVQLQLFILRDVRSVPVLSARRPLGSGIVRPQAARFRYCPPEGRSVPEIGEAAQECRTHWWATNPVVQLQLFILRDVPSF